MSQQSLVDLNVQVVLAKRPSPSYPQSQQVFQVKYVPPIPTDQVAQGQVVVRNMFLSIDATMRIWISGIQSYMKPINPGDIMKGMGVAQIIYSKNNKFKQGDIVLGLTYWQKYSVLDGKTLTPIPKDYPKPQNFLGVLGISGLTAYFGLHKIGKIKKGESVVVSAAAGAVGQLAVQLAKNEGCVVVAIAGSNQKCKYLQQIGADYTINYNEGKLRQKIKKALPEGVDVYFDNVGGQTLDEVLMLIRQGARIIACGAISGYNQFNDSKQKPYRLKNYARIIIKRATIQGYLYFDYHKQFKSAIGTLSQLIDQGKLKYRVDYLNGVEECPRGLHKLLLGKNDGKVIIRVNNSLTQSKL